MDELFIPFKLHVRRWKEHAPTFWSWLRAQSEVRGSTGDQAQKVIECMHHQGFHDFNVIRARLYTARLVSSSRVRWVNSATMAAMRFLKSEYALGPTPADPEELAPMREAKFYLVYATKLHVVERRRRLLGGTIKR